MKIKSFRCFVPGCPVTQGGNVGFWDTKKKRYVQRTVGAGDLRTWRRVMKKTFAWEMVLSHHQKFDGPLTIKMTFLLPRLAEHPKKKDEPIEAETGYDLDKLIRAVWDSLKTGGVIKDDNRICTIRQTDKRYARLCEKPGVLVEIEPAIRQADYFEIIPEAIK